MIANVSPEFALSGAVIVMLASSEPPKKEPNQPREILARFTSPQMTTMITTTKPATASTFEMRLVRVSSGGGGIVKGFPEVCMSCAIISARYMIGATLSSFGRTPFSRARKPYIDKTDLLRYHFDLGMEPHFTRNTVRHQQKPPKRVFFAASIVMFFLSLSAADSIGFVPYYIDGTPSSDERVALSNLPELGSEPVPAEEPTLPTALPERIIIPAIGLDLPVSNPATRDLASLDAILQNGPARYVDSAELGEKGNVLIFAHSSRLPVVHNQMYRAFNRVSELSPGDTITISGEGKSYIYTVSSVRRGNASDEIIDLSQDGGTRLTLVTCDTLTSKDSRWILEADFVGVL